MGNRVRVLFADHETRLSGGEQDLLDLVAAMDHGRIDVHVALPGEGPLSDALVRVGATVHYVSMAPAMRGVSRWEMTRRPWVVLPHAMSFALAAFRLGRLAMRLRPQVVHTNSMKAHLLMAVPARLLGIPLIWHVRDILSDNWLRKAFAAAAWRIPVRVVCISQAVRRQFEGSPALLRTRVVYNGIHRDKFKEVVAGPELLGAKEGEPVVGIVGQIARWKGQDVFIEAAAHVLRIHPNARFAVVGECLFPQNEGEYEDSLHRRARELGISDRVMFTGWTDQPEVLMSAMDVLVHASRLPEPFGRVIVEGMAAGAVVVASTEGAGPEIITQNEGRIVPAGDPDALAQTLIDLLGDEVTRARLAKAARLGAERFDISATADGVDLVYRELFNGRMSGL